MNLNELSTDSPVPQDDGAADHLEGFEMPEITLKVTNGATVNVARLGFSTIIYVYLMTGRPDTLLPDG